MYQNIHNYEAGKMSELGVISLNIYIDTRIRDNSFSDLLDNGEFDIALKLNIKYTNFEGLVNRMLDKNISKKLKKKCLDFRF